MESKIWAPDGLNSPRVLLSPVFQWTELGKTYTCTHTNIHIHIPPYACMHTLTCIYSHIRKMHTHTFILVLYSHNFISIPSTLTHGPFHSSVVPVHTCFFHLWQQEIPSTQVPFCNLPPDTAGMRLHVGQGPNRPLGLTPRWPLLCYSHPDPHILILCKGICSVPLLDCQNIHST